MDWFPLTWTYPSYYFDASDPQYTVSQVAADVGAADIQCDVMSSCGLQ